MRRGDRSTRPSEPIARERKFRHMVSETDIIMAYRLLLGREPENRAVVTGQAGHYPDIQSLREGFMTSPEFRAVAGGSFSGSPDHGTKVLIWPAIDVDVYVSSDILERMVKRVEGEFIYLGTREPHWSVLTEERFKAENIHDHEDEFFRSGELQFNDLLIAAARSGVELSRYRSCFELGCGLGRCTIWLARQFSSVVGGDISTVHLEHAAATATKTGLTNVSFVNLNEIRRYQDLQPFDVFFSIIVLQHNPPPLMAFILETILTKLTRGGIAYFQIPTYILDYRFSVDDYLVSENPVGQVEVHCLPQTALFEIIARTGCRVLEMREDGAIGALAISNRLLIQKLE